MIILNICTSVYLPTQNGPTDGKIEIMITVSRFYGVFFHVYIPVRLFMLQSHRDPGRARQSPVVAPWSAGLYRGLTPGCAGVYRGRPDQPGRAGKRF